METMAHIGRKIGRIRELRGMKQDTLARELGISQQAVSKIEQRVTIREEVLQKIARVLAVTTEDIKHFTEELTFNKINTFQESIGLGLLNIETVFNNINNAFYGSSSLINYQVNPIEKIVSLYDGKMVLLERLLQSEKEKNSLMEHVLRGTKKE